MDTLASSKIPIIFIVYDGIENSVFVSQVLEPMLAVTRAGTPVTIISFERYQPSLERIKLIKETPINLIILKKIPFLGFWSLNVLIPSLKKKLLSYTAYQMYARGPHAGYLALHACDIHRCTKIIIQARGLLSHEFQYINKNVQNWLHQRMVAWRSENFERLERFVYGASSLSCSKLKNYVSIETVSDALRNYLIEHYKTVAHIITIASDDIPRTIDPMQKKVWRSAVRAELMLNEKVHVYCYNGSAKAWQLPNDVVLFFKEKLKENVPVFLLILTNDTNTFKKLLQLHAISTAYFRVISIKHEDIYRYLSACDTGIIFRENNILNWVSRPTKVLEYRAAGLSIAHNNTISFLKTNPL